MSVRYEINFLNRWNIPSSWRMADKPDLGLSWSDLKQPKFGMRRIVINEDRKQAGHKPLWMWKTIC